MKGRKFMALPKILGGKPAEAQAPEGVCTLDQVKPGYGGVIQTVAGEGALRRRLLDMGLTPGTAVTVRKVAPMGDPLELFLRSYVLTLRKEEAASITMRDVTKV